MQLRACPARPEDRRPDRHTMWDRRAWKHKLERWLLLARPGLALLVPWLPGRRWKSGRARGAGPCRRSAKLFWADFDCFARGAVSLQLAKSTQSTKQEPPRAGMNRSS